MSGERFDPAEIAGAVPPGELDADLVAAARLERVAAEDVVPSDGFADRVMAAVAAEPDPRPTVAAASAVRALRPAGLVAALGAAWRTLTSPRPPGWVRLQAGALLLIATLAVGLVGAGAIAGAMRIAEGPVPSVAPSPIASPEPTVAPEQSPSPSPSPTAAESATPSESPEPSDSAEPSESPEPTETPEPAGLSGGGLSGGGLSGAGSAAEPTSTPRPEATPGSSQDGEDGGAPQPTDTPEATGTPRPTGTPWPSATPEPTGG